MSQEEQFTVVFVDMVSHSPYVAALTAEERRRFYSTFMATVEPLAEKFGADRPSFTGDGYMLAFKSANVAVSFGLKLTEQWRRAFENGRLREFQPVDLRCGAHCGVPEQVRWNLVGPVCNIAKRVCDLSDGSCLLITQAVLDHLDQTKYDWEAMSSFPLKGDHLKERVLYRLTGRRAPVRGKKLTAEDWFLRAMALIGTPQENSKEEEKCYVQALRLRPNYSQAHVNYGNLLDDLGRTEEAEAHYQEALRLRPDYPEAQYNYALLLKGMGRPQEAEEHYKEALRLRPDYAEAHNNYAILLAKTGRWEEAEAHLKEALHLNPDLAQAHHNYAVLLDNLGRHEEAEAHYKEALRLRPEDPNYHDNYALLLEEMGQTEEAEHHRQEAERLRTEGGQQGTQTNP